MLIQKEVKSMFSKSKATITQGRCICVDSETTAMEMRAQVYEQVRPLISTAIQQRNAKDQFSEYINNHDSLPLRICILNNLKKAESTFYQTKRNTCEFC